MSKKRVAILDLGTNTFHLLIADIKDGAWTIALKEKTFVKLAESGIKKIGEAAFTRGIECITEYSKIIKRRKVDVIKVVATAALRQATNAKEFIEAANEATGLEIEVIDGDREAELIYKGATAACKPTPFAHLIMDIGGGSTEMIIGREGHLLWKKSYPMGGATLSQKFHRDDPITEAQENDLRRHAANMMKDLALATERYEIKEFIGASGAFDSYLNILDPDTVDAQPSCGVVEVEDFEDVFKELLDSTQPERLEIPGLVQDRATMIVSASILIKMIIEAIEVDQIRISDWALKEGLIVEEMESE